MNKIIVTDIELGIWQGLGGAITEATAYNFAKLDSEKQKKLLTFEFKFGRLNTLGRRFGAPFF